MKKGVLLSFFAVLFAFSTRAAIQLQEPVVDFENGYIEFTGFNTDGNYKFILNTYEWPSDHGPQFQLTVEPIDVTKDAAFSTDDLNDPNYWEPMFMSVTEQMAGQAMTVQDNVKRLYLGDVQLLPSQFIDYNNLHIIGFDLKKDYTLPSGCLQYAGQHLEEIDVKCDGTMTLSPNSLPANKAFTVNVYTQPVYDVWNNYKMSYNCDYIINYDNGSTQAAITGVKVNVSVEDESFTEQLPATGFPEVEIEAPISNFYLNRFEVDVNVEVDEIFMDYAITQEGQSPGGWTSIHATKTEDGKWVADNINLNILQGLEVGKTSVLNFDFISGYVDEVGDRLRYDNGGIMYRVKFVCGAASVAKPGDVNGDGECTGSDVTALYNAILYNDYSKIVNGDQNGDNTITASDVTAVYNIILGLN